MTASLILVLWGLARLPAPAQAKPLFFGEERLIEASSHWAKPERYKAEQPKYRRDREVDVLHVRLEIALDPA